MSKQSLLLVDGDTRSLRVLEVSLRKAGFMVTAALSVQDALDKLELHVPDLIISETAFPDGDGFDLRSRVRANPEWAEIPFIFLTAEAAIENKIRGLELGVDDYLTKPIYIKEIVTRINILLQKRQRVRFEERRDGRTRFAGRVQDMPVVDVIQTIEISRKSGVIQFVGERGRQAAIYFRDGRVIDAEAGSLQGEDAVYRLLTWSEGEFEVVFRTVRRREVITMSSQALLMEGMRRLDEWSRLFEQLPPLTHRFEVDTIELAARLGDVPDDNNRILRLFDGKRTLLEVIDASDVGDLECLQAISRLYFEELLIDLDHGKAPRRDTIKSMPVVEIGGHAPVSEDASGAMPESVILAASKGAAPELVAPEGEAEAAGATGGAAAVGATGEAAAAAGATGEAAALAAGTARELEVVGDVAGPVITAETATAAGDGGEREPVGPWMGGYLPTSLRLIDEAVAAAEAIEPSLYDESAEAHLPAEGHSGNGASRTAPLAGVAATVEAGPAAMASGAAAAGSAEAPGGAVGPTRPDPTANLRLAEREDSGLRMIGSLGRDRAEASGELATPGEQRPARSQTARELVTILPRRSTREVPVLPRELAGSGPISMSPAAAPRPASAIDPSSPAASSQRIVLPGGSDRAPSRLRRLLRGAPGGGPGLGALLLIVLAVVLAGTAVLLRLRRHAPSSQSSATVRDGGPSAGPETPTAATGTPGGEGAEDSGSAAPGMPAGRPAPGGAGGAAGSDTPEAAVAAAGEAGTAASPPPVGSLGREDGTVSADAGTGSAGGHASDAGGTLARRDRLAEAKALCDQAKAALEESEYERAYELTSAALKLAKTVRAYTLRARAEQRLGRVDDALRSLDAAAEITPNAGAVWEQRGRILWAARRHDEARAAFSRFLELSPNSPGAKEIQRLLGEPR